MSIDKLTSARFFEQRLIQSPLTAFLKVCSEVASLFHLKPEIFLSYAWPKSRAERDIQIFLAQLQEYLQEPGIKVLLGLVKEPGDLRGRKKKKCSIM